MGSTEDDDMHTLPRPRFDATLNWGHVVLAVTFIVTASSQWYLTDYRLRSVEDSIKSLAGITVQQALTAERLNQHDRRLDRLEGSAR